QRWRAPLREALDWLAGELHSRYEREGSELFTDPWGARDAYGTVVGSDEASIARFAAERMRRPDDLAARVRARELLELERNALRMFTSCGWFFDDIAGIETVQILRYAARAIELAGADAPRLEAGVLERLARAHSNDPEAGTGRDVYLQRVKRRVAAGAGAGGTTSWTRCASPSGFTSTSRWETSTTCSSSTCATCTVRSSSGWPSGSSSPSRSTSRGRCSSGSRSTSPGCSTGSPGSRRGAAWSCCFQGSTSPCWPPSLGRTGSSRSTGCARRSSAGSA